jgi:antitoxin HigA-1
MKMHNPAHPGEVLKEAYLEPLHLSVTEFARRIGISRKCASELINGHSGLGLETAHRIAKATDTTPDLWLTMQLNHDLWQAKVAKLTQHLRVEKLAQDTHYAIAA